MIKETRVLREGLERLGQRVQLDSRVHRGSRVQPVQVARLDQQDRPDHLDSKGILELVDSEDRMVARVVLDTRDSQAEQDLLDFKETLDLREIPEVEVGLDLRDIQDQLATLDRPAKQVYRDQQVQLVPRDRPVTKDSRDRRDLLEIPVQRDFRRDRQVRREPLVYRDGPGQLATLEGRVKREVREHRVHRVRLDCLDLLDPQVSQVQVALLVPQGTMEQLDQPVRRDPRVHWEHLDPHRLEPPDHQEPQEHRDQLVQRDSLASLALSALVECKVQPEQLDHLVELVWLVGLDSLGSREPLGLQEH